MLSICYTKETPIKGKRALRIKAQTNRTFIRCDILSPLIILLTCGLRPHRMKRFARSGKSLSHKAFCLTVLLCLLDRKISFGYVLPAFLKGFEMVKIWGKAHLLSVLLIRALVPELRVICVALPSGKWNNIFKPKTLCDKLFPRQTNLFIRCGRSPQVRGIIKGERMSQRIKVRLVCAFIRKTLFPLIGVSLVRFFSLKKRNEQ